MKRERETGSDCEEDKEKSKERAGRERYETRFGSSKSLLRNAQLSNKKRKEKKKEKERKG